MDDGRQPEPLVRTGPQQAVAQRPAHRLVEPRRRHLDGIARDPAHVQAVEPAGAGVAPWALLDDVVIVDAEMARLGEGAVRELEQADRARGGRVQVERVPGESPAPVRARERLGRDQVGRVLAEEGAIRRPDGGRALRRRGYDPQQLRRLLQHLVGEGEDGEDRHPEEDARPARPPRAPRRQAPPPRPEAPPSTALASPRPVLHLGMVTRPERDRGAITGAARGARDDRCRSRSSTRETFSRPTPQSRATIGSRVSRSNGFRMSAAAPPTSESNEAVTTRTGMEASSGSLRWASMNSQPLITGSIRSGRFAWACSRAILPSEAVLTS